MSTSAVDNLQKMLESLTGISELERSNLLAEVKKIKKIEVRNEFKIERILRDKAIVVNILNSAIEDLEKKKMEVERSNKLLFEQAQELKQQKQIIEEKSLELKDNLRKLELSYRELEQFSYIASHDLKSPLRTISSFAQLLKKRYYGKLDEQADEFVEFIVAGVYQMNEVIAALLDYSRVGDPEERFSFTDLNEVLEIVKQNLRKHIEENQVNIVAEELPVISVHKTGMVQLFQNLIDNSIKFRGGEPPVISISSHYLEDHWEFKVSDNGLGMDESYQKKLFLPFQRLTHHKKNGMGIGLAICKKIVKMHHGDIYYQSSHGKGTTFVFTINTQG